MKGFVLLLALLAFYGCNTAAVDEDSQANRSKEDFIGLIHPPLPAHVQNYSAGLLSPRISISLTSNDTLRSAWLNEFVRRDEAGIAYWQVQAALTFNMKELEGEILWADDIGSGCYIDMDEGKSDLLIAHAVFSEPAPEDECKWEEAQQVRSAWLADTAAMQFEEVGDLSRVMCYRGACP